MKAKIIFVFACIIAVALAQLVHDKDAVNKINSKQQSWKAGFNPRFKGMTLDEAKGLLTRPELMLDGSYKRGYPPSTKISNNIPSSFDARDKWPGCVHPILDQGSCGSCWAFGSTEAISDRFCIQSNSSINVVLSPQALVSCDWWAELGCNGGILQTAWDWVAVNGIVSMECWPYQSGKGDVPSCRSTCMDGSNYKLYKVKYDTIATHIGVKSMQTALLDGPIEASFLVFDDFFSYTGGVYQRTSDSPAGGHAIKILGWGHDEKSGLDYWLCANSWGVNWGENGFFKIQRGVNECFIETDAVAGDADV